MTRFVTLMNPRPRYRTRRSRRRMRMTRNRMGRFVRRGATRRRRRSVAHMNPPRRRIYRSRRSVRRIYRRRRSHSNPSHHSPAMRRKIGLAVKRAMAARARVGVIRRGGKIRSFRRRSVSRRGGFGGGSLMSSFRSSLSKPLLLKAGGAVAASFGVGYIMNRWGATLPLANNKYGRMAYTLGIPVLAAYLIRRKNRDLAEGLVIGGLVMTINTLMQGFAVTRALATPAPAGAVGSYAVAGELGTGSFGYYPQGMHDSAGLGGGNVAFPASAW